METNREIRLRRAWVQHLEGLQRAGVSHVKRVRARKEPAEHEQPVDEAGQRAAPPRHSSPAQPASSVRPVSRPDSAAPVAARPAPAAGPAALPLRIAADEPLPPPLPADERPAALKTLQQQVAACRRCEELCRTRKQTVFGVGNPQARLCFVGEAPGADEDVQGVPFVGAAGQLLTRIIEACTLKREEVFILNALKCRPPGNRTPTAEEMANCHEYLERQLEVIQPEYICCLGMVAARAILQPAPSASMRSLRGRFHEYRGIPVLCTYHPAYLLRNPAAKRDVWEDMQRLMAAMGIDLSKR